MLARLFSPFLRQQQPSHIRCPESGLSFCQLSPGGRSASAACAAAPRSREGQRQRPLHCQKPLARPAAAGGRLRLDAAKVHKMTDKKKEPSTLLCGGLQKEGGDLLSRIAVQYHRRARA
jgi:hypothetical protein